MGERTRTVLTAENPDDEKKRREEADFAAWEQELSEKPIQGQAPDQAPGTVEASVDEAIPTEAEQVKAEIASLPDANVRYTDAEILGKHYPVRQAIGEIGNQRLKFIESTKAKWNNALDTPQKIRRGFAVSIAERRYNRHQARLDEVAHLPDGHRLKERRIAKLARAEGKMNRAKGVYNLLTETMEARTKSVGENAERRRAAYKSELLGRRESALARKTMCHELRAQGAGRLEARDILKDIPKEHAMRVGKIAARAELSRRAFGQAERASSKATKYSAELQQKSENNEARIVQYNDEAQRADSILLELSGGPDSSSPAEGSLPFKEAHVAELKAQLEALPADDPDRSTLQVQISEAQHAVDIVVQREIPYWKSVAESSRNHVKVLEEARLRLDKEQQDAQLAIAKSADEVKAKKATFDAATRSRTAAAEAALTK